MPKILFRGELCIFFVNNHIAFNQTTEKEGIIWVELKWRFIVSINRSEIRLRRVKCPARGA